MRPKPSQEFRFHGGPRMNPFTHPGPKSQRAGTPVPWFTLGMENMKVRSTGLISETICWWGGALFVSPSKVGESRQTKMNISFGVRHTGFKSQLCHKLAI